MSMNITQINEVASITLTASISPASGALEILYDSAAITLLEDLFPGDTNVMSVSVALADFTSGGTTYYVFAYTTNGTSVTAWAKSGADNTLSIPMPTGAGSTTVGFVAVAIPPGGTTVYFAPDPKIRLTRRPLE
jgi:hypothetical protein